MMPPLADILAEAAWTVAHTALCLAVGAAAGAVFAWCRGDWRE